MLLVEVVETTTTIVLVVVGEIIITINLVERVLLVVEVETRFNKITIPDHSKK